MLWVINAQVVLIVNVENKMEEKIKKLKLKPYGFAQPTMAGINIVQHKTDDKQSEYFTVDLVLWVQTEDRTDFPIILPTHLLGNMSQVVSAAYDMGMNLAGNVINMAPIMDEDCNVVDEISLGEYLNLGSNYE
jgi:hypothetical protein